MVEKHHSVFFTERFRDDLVASLTLKWELRYLKPVSAEPISIAKLNDCSKDAFVGLVGGIYEHSPWIAEKTWANRPFSSMEDLKTKLDATLRAAPLEDHLALIRAHPDLAGRLAKAGQLTNESTAEQRSAGLDALSKEESVEFDALNGLYVTRFGFPFVICARLNDRRTILEAFRRRLRNTQVQEIEAALAEIRQIAALRLAQIVHD